MRRVSASFSADAVPGVRRVVSAENLPSEWEPGLRLSMLANSKAERDLVERIAAGGISNLGWVATEELRVGDVIAPQRDKGQAVVLFRESDQHHALQLTNRCNSYCLMCSQPPTPQDDAWMVSEALESIKHIKTSPRTLGFSGGEPLLLGSRLRRIVDCVAEHHPSTTVEILTNGRRLSNSALASNLLGDLEHDVCWLVPLYGPADFIHDFVVQAPGAFDETVGGLLSLQEHRQPIQLRVVLIRPVLENLVELCGFVGRNFPFVREVALMACEPIGFALANREHCQVDLADWTDTLQEATRVLQRHNVPFLFMNTPLCALPPSSWKFAHMSISDWKNVYASECSACTVRDRCAGLFAWHERGWKPTTVRAIRKVTL